MQQDRITKTKQQFGLDAFELVGQGQQDAVQQHRVKHQATIDLCIKRIEEAEAVIACGGDRKMAADVGGAGWETVGNDVGGAPPSSASGGYPTPGSAPGKADVKANPFMT